MSIKAEQINLVVEEGRIKLGPEQLDFLEEGLAVLEPKQEEKKEFVLTDENYFSEEADKLYMSVSQYKSYLKCEAAAQAKVDGEYIMPKSNALIEGSYVHAWLEGTQEQFKDENPDMFSSKGATKGQLKANFKVADLMIETLKNDKMCMFALEGENEVLMTGELFGVPWKIKIDCYNPAGNRFSDLKTVKDIRERHYVEGKGWVSFIEKFGYVTQLAVYSEIERQNRNGEEWLDSYIVAVSKQDPPDKEIIMIDEESLRMELMEVEKNMERIKGIKEGIVEPKRCNTCNYCRMTKKVSAVTHYLDLLG